MAWLMEKSNVENVSVIKTKMRKGSVKGIKNRIGCHENLRGLLPKWATKSPKKYENSMLNAKIVILKNLMCMEKTSCSRCILKKSTEMKTMSSILDKKINCSLKMCFFDKNRFWKKIKINVEVYRKSAKYSFWIISWCVWCKFSKDETWLMSNKTVIIKNKFENTFSLK